VPAPLAFVAQPEVAQRCPIEGAYRGSAKTRQSPRPLANQAREPVADPVEARRLVSERAARPVAWWTSISLGSSPEQRIALAQEGGAVNQRVHFVEPSGFVHKSPNRGSEDQSAGRLGALEQQLDGKERTEPVVVWVATTAIGGTRPVPTRRERLRPRPPVQSLCPLDAWRTLRDES